MEHLRLGSSPGVFQVAPGAYRMPLWLKRPSESGASVRTEGALTAALGIQTRSNEAFQASFALVRVG